jgi:hypothetical protein
MGVCRYELTEVRWRWIEPLLPGRTGRGEAFAVLCEASKAGWPGKASFDPSSGQQHEASLGLCVLDDLEPDAMLGRRLFSRLPHVALIHIGQLNVLSRDVLNLAGGFADPGAVLLIAGVTRSANRWPSASTAVCTFEAFLRLAPS